MSTREEGWMGTVQEKNLTLSGSRREGGIKERCNRVKRLGENTEMTETNRKSLIQGTKEESRIGKEQKNAGL
jgi:hypothetical protein